MWERNWNERQKKNKREIDVGEKKGKLKIKNNLVIKKNK